MSNKRKQIPEKIKKKFLNKGIIINRKDENNEEKVNKIFNNSCNYLEEIMGDDKIQAKSNNNNSDSKKIKLFKKKISSKFNTK